MLPVQGSVPVVQRRRLWSSGVGILVEVGDNVGGEVGGSDSGGAGEKTLVDVGEDSGGIL